MSPVEKLKQIMAKLIELPVTSDRLDLVVNECSNGRFSSVQAVSDAIISDIQSYSNPSKFLWEKCNIDINNDDVGSIIGSDASGGASLNKYDVIPEVGNIASIGYPYGNKAQINGLEVIFPDPDTLNASGQFIMKCMYAWWIKNSLDIIERAYGLRFTTTSFTQKMPVYLDPISSSGGSVVMAYVSTTFNASTGNTSSIYCVVNTDPAAYGDMDLSDLNGVANSYAGSLEFLDRTLAHELTHGVMASNIPGFNVGLPAWFIEGSAELIAGADDTRKQELLNVASSASLFEDGLSDTPSSNLSWYTTGYIWLRWFVRHVSSYPLDLSFDVSFPDIEIYEYTVSDGIAFEYGRINNHKFSAANDELIDFLLRDHVGLKKWELCTSPEYLHSGYGTTLRVPFDDATRSEYLDYINLKSICRYDVCAIFEETFLSEDPFNVFSYIIGPAISTDGNYKQVSVSLLERNNLYCPQNSEFIAYNSLNGYSFDQFVFTSSFLRNTRVAIIFLTGHFTLLAFFNSIYGGSTVTDAKSAITNVVSNLLSHSVRWRIYDFSSINVQDARDTVNVNNITYLNSLKLTQDDLELISFIQNDKNISSVIEYVNCKQKVLDSFANITEFRSRAIVNTAPVLIPSNVPVDTCYSQEFADLLWSVVDLDFGVEFDHAEYIEMSLSGIFNFGIPILNENICDSSRYGGPVFSGDPLVMKDSQINLFDRYDDTSAEPSWAFEIKPKVDAFAASLNSLGKNNGTVMIIGLELLNIWCKSLIKIENYLNWIRQIFINDSNNDICVGFVPPPLYNQYIYDYYVSIKSLCLNVGIPVAIDDYVCMKSSSTSDYLEFASILYGYDPSVVVGTYEMLVSSWVNTLLGQDCVTLSHCGLNHFYFYLPTDNLIPGEDHVAKYNAPCYYISFTDLPFSDMIVPDKEIAIQAIDGVSGDVLTTNLHTIYDPLSPAYYQGGGICKPVYDFVVDPTTNRTITGLINHHNDGANVPNVDANYSYPVYGTGCPWLIYPDNMKELYDTIYFYFTRDNYTGTITYQLCSNHDSFIKPIFQTVVFGSPDTENYTTKYPLYAAGGVMPFSPTQYSYVYQPPTPPGGKPPPAVTVVVTGNKYNFDLTTTLSSNTSPLYPINPQDSKLSNFSLRCTDGEWKSIATFNSHNVESSVETTPCLFTLADTMRWGAILPYVDSNFYNMYVYDKSLGNIKQLKPLRVLNPNMIFKEERGFGAITLPNLWASHTDNIYGIRYLKSNEHEIRSILDISFMESVADGDVINIHGNYEAYGGDTTFNSSLGPGSIVFTDPFDEFYKIDVIFTDESGTNKFVTSWTRDELYEAIFGNRDIDFDITRGSVHPLFWKINKSECNKIVFYGLEQNCGIIDIVGYRRVSRRYLVVPNGYAKREFNMFAYSNDKDNTLDYKQQFEIYNKIISSYSLNDDLYIYLGAGYK